MRMVGSGQRQKRGPAFTLIETTAALGIMGFVTIGLLSLYPMGLRQAEAELLETQGMQMARALFTTLRSTPFTAADCYGSAIDLSAIRDAGVALQLYAPTSGPVTTTIQDSSRYAMLLAIRPAEDAPAGVEARRITMTLSPLHRTEPKASYEVVIVRASDS